MICIARWSRREKKNENRGLRAPNVHRLYIQVYRAVGRVVMTLLWWPYVATVIASELIIRDMNLRIQHIVPLIGVVLMAAAAAPGAHAQNAGCAELVRTIYRTIANGGPSGRSRSAGTAARIRYSVRTTSRWQGKTRTTVSNVDLLATENDLYVASDQMEMQQDATTAVVVYPARRQIIINTSNLDAFRKSRGAMLPALRDSVLATSDVTECAAVSSGGSDRRVTFRLRERARRELKMETVTIALNSANGTIQRIVFQPTTESSLAGVQVDFHAIDYNYNTDRFSRPLLQRFVDAAGRPLPKYSGYTVRDARAGARGLR